MRYSFEESRKAKAKAKGAGPMWTAKEIGAVFGKPGCMISGLLKNPEFPKPAFPATAGRTAKYAIKAVKAFFIKHKEKFHVPDQIRN